jgi:hypothetical protein
VATVVGTLQVDLVANTATFSYDLDQGGKAARKFGADASEGFGSAREGAMLLEEATGVRLPRALTGLLSRIGPLGAAFQTMLPVAGVVAAIGIIAELVSKHQEATEKMREATGNFNEVQASTFRGLDNGILDAGIKADELAGDHLGKLVKELQKINNQNLSGLIDNLDRMSKSADSVFAGLKANAAETWLQISHGSSGAAHALQEFKTQYDSLVDQGKTKEAHDLLVGTLNDATAAYARFYAQQGGHGSDAKQLQAQQQLLDVLKAQITAEDKLAERKTKDQGNARTVAGNAIGKDQDDQLKRDAEAQRWAADQEEKTWDENFKAVVSALQQAEKQKIEATRAGSAARVAAIEAAIKEEQAHGLQDTAYFKELQQAKVNAVRENNDQMEKLNDAMHREEMEGAQKMAALRNATNNKQAQFELAMRQISAAQAEQAELNSENVRFAITQEASAKYLAFLQQDGTKNAAAIKQIHDKIEQETQAHENKLTQIRETAEEQRNKRILASETQLEEGIARNMAQTLVTGKNLAQSMEKMGAQMLEGMVSHTLMMIMTQDWQRASDARTAAANAYASVSAIPVVGPVLAPEAAAGAFAAVMAFEGGGIIPGVSGGRDSVNAVLEPEEMVLPRTLSSGLQKMIRDGGANNKGGDTHIHVQSHVHNPQALDADGMHDILEAHADTIAAHVSNHFRKQNK